MSGVKMVEGERTSEKRFGETERNCYYTSLIFDNHTQEELGTNKVVKLLNALHDENEQLRKELDNFKPVTFQDMQKGGTIILYSKGDIDE